MLPLTRTQANAMLLNTIAQINGISRDDVERGFAVQPTHGQRLQNRIRELSPFLKMVSFQYSKDIAGDVVSIGAGLIGSTTDTTQPGVKRQTINPVELTDRSWRAEKINYDTHIDYADIDEWRHKPEFIQLFYRNIELSIAESRLCVAWNGRHRAKTSDIKANPLLEDVAMGWLERTRVEADERIFGGKDDEVVTLGAGEDFKNIDALALAARSIIPRKFKNRKDLVVLIGDRLLEDKYFQITNKAGQIATEVLAAEGVTSLSQRVGKMAAYSVQYFPEDALMITPLQNLQIIVQQGSERRRIIDTPDEDKIKTFQSENITFQIGDFEALTLVENIQLTESAEADNEGSGA